MLLRKIFTKPTEVTGTIWTKLDGNLTNKITYQYFGYDEVALDAFRHHLHTRHGYKYFNHKWKESGEWKAIPYVVKTYDMYLPIHSETKDTYPATVIVKCPVNYKDELCPIAIQKNIEKIKLPISRYTTYTMYLDCARHRAEKGGDLEIYYSVCL